MADENLLTISLPNIVSILLIWTVGAVLIGLILVAWNALAGKSADTPPIAQPS